MTILFWECRCIYEYLVTVLSRFSKCKNFHKIFIFVTVPIILTSAITWHRSYKIPNIYCLNLIDVRQLFCILLQVSILTQTLKRYSESVMTLTTEIDVIASWRWQLGAWSGAGHTNGASVTRQCWQAVLMQKSRRASKSTSQTQD